MARRDHPDHTEPLDARPPRFRSNNQSRHAHALQRSLFSANAEPHAVLLFLQLVLSSFPGPVSGIAAVTNHYPIALTQRDENGFRGIGRSQHLNSLYAFTNDLFFRQDITVVFFYIIGCLNSAGLLSRNFGAEVEEGILTVREATDMAVPRLESTACPVLLKTSVVYGKGTSLATVSEQWNCDRYVGVS